MIRERFQALKIMFVLMGKKGYMFNLLHYVLVILKGVYNNSYFF